MSSDFSNASGHARRMNIKRYQRLLKTYLTNNEREFIERRLGEEQKALAEVMRDSSIRLVKTSHPNADEHAS